nr:hypothetical protein [Massilia sp. JS1662]
MLNYTVLFRRRKDVVPDPAREAALIECMHALEDQIDTIRAWRVSAAEVERPICWHYVPESGSTIRMGSMLTYIIRYTRR